MNSQIRLERKNGKKVDSVEYIKDMEIVHDQYNESYIDDFDSREGMSDEESSEYKSEKEGAAQEEEEDKMSQAGSSQSQDTTLYSVDNFSKPKNYIDFYNNLEWITGSVHLTTYIDEEGSLKKKPVYPGSWSKPTFKEDFNSCYFLTGQKNNMVVLDIDEMDHPDCQKMILIAKKNCTMIVETRKGLHFYFLYEDDLNSKKQGKNDNGKVIWDFQSNGQMIYCPPSSYEDCKTGEVYEYKLLKCEPLVQMPTELKKIILSKEPKIEKKKIMQTNPIQHILEKNVEHNTIDDEDSVKKMIKGLAPNRSTNVDSWITGGYCLKNSGYDVEYFDLFSKLHYPNYNQSEVQKKFYELKVRSYKEKKLGIGTMWMWLKEDNPEEFRRLKIEQNPEAYKFEREEYDHFRINVFKNILQEDNKNLGDDFLLTFEESRSYKYFNAFHIKNYRRDGIYDISRETPLAYTDKAMRDFFVKHEGKKNVFIDMWGESNAVKHITDFIFHPVRNHVVEEDEMNLFTGFKFENKDNDGSYNDDVIKPYLEHVHNRLADGDRNVSEYILNWISHLLQKPHIKAEVMMVFYSHTQGVGKNLFTNALEKIFGKYYLQLESMEAFTSPFNSTMQSKILAVMDEVQARARSIENELKNAITRHRVGITYKGQEKYFMDDKTNYIFTTNNELVLKVTKDDRRMMIIGCKEEKLPVNEALVLVKFINDDNSIRQLFNFFMKRDISNFLPQDLIRTEYKETLMMNDLPPVIRMIKDQSKSYEGERLKSKDIYLRSKVYAKDNNLSSAYTDQRCYKDLKIFFGKYNKLDSKKISYYEFPQNLDEVVEDMIKTGLKIPGDNIIPPPNHPKP